MCAVNKSGSVTLPAFQRRVLNTHTYEYIYIHTTYTHIYNFIHTCTYICIYLDSSHVERP